MVGFLGCAVLGPESMIMMGAFQLNIFYDIMPYIKITFSRKRSILNILGFVPDSWSAFDSTYLPFKIGKGLSSTEKRNLAFSASYWNCSAFYKVTVLKYIIHIFN